MKKSNKGMVELDKGRKEKEGRWEKKKKKIRRKLGDWIVDKGRITWNIKKEKGIPKVM